MKKIICLTLLVLLGSEFIFAGDYIGDEACKSCHTQEHKEWSGSHHDLAMEEANSNTVLGDFNNATFNYNGLVSTFFKKDGKFMVNTDGANGKLQDFEISYTFGVYPLQQYMVNFPDGKVQVLTIAWDSRPKADGGQRWFHIHKDDKVTADDVLHWTGPNLNWNYMCADCHSTNFKKNYDPQTKKYNSTYEHINVSCEECHGAGEEHKKWAQDPKSYNGTLADTLKFLGKKNSWSIDEKTHKPVLDGEINRDEVMLCAKCHSRRTQFGDDFDSTKNYHDNYRLATLSETLYESDGKIKDEVYVYGSFVQSKMYEAGVSCSDCHDSHSLERNAVGDNVCNSCHIRSDYDTPKHTHHKKGSASCIDCHMPSKMYMGVDERNDHSFRVPRPDLSDKYGTSNACTKCHENKSNKNLTDSMKKWYGEIPKGHQNFAHSFHASRTNSEDSFKELYKLLMSGAPDIAKATLIPRLGMYPSRQTHMTSLQMLASKDPNKRIAALQALQGFPVKFIMKNIFNTLNDEVKSVRIEAMRILLSYNTGRLNAQQQAVYDKVFKEYKDSLLFLSDRAEAQVALASLYERTGELSNAQKAYEEALRIQKFYIHAYINYAHFYQQQKKEDKAKEVLEKGLELIGKEPLLLEPYALWHIRNAQKDKAINILKEAAQKYPKNTRIQYLYAVSIANENLDETIKILENALKYSSGDLATLNGLVYYYKQKNNYERSAFYEKKLQNMMKIQQGN